MSSNQNQNNVDINYLRLLFAEESDAIIKDYKKLADFFPALVFVFDTEKQRIAYTNKQFSSLLGYSEDETLNESFNWDKIVFKEDLDRFNEELKKCYNLEEDDSYTYNNRLNHKEGKWRYFRTKATVLKRNVNGKPGAMLFVAEDITEQQMNSDEFERTKQLISETEKMHHFGMYSYDVASDCFNWSDGIYKLFDVSREEHPAPGYDFFTSFIVAEDRERMKSIRQHLPDGTSEYENVYTIQTQKGAIKILLDIVKVLRSENGGIIKYIGSLRDITKERLFERELQKNIKDLHNSNRELEEFAYVASHDMQEPLRKITTFSSRLYEKFNEQLGEEGKLYLDRMNVAANNMRILIDNLLEISRTSREEQPFKITNLNKILSDSINELELSIEENHVEIKIEKDLPEIEAVPALMHQLFTNLLNNSIKFRSKEPPLIKISSKKIDKNRRQQLLLPEKDFYEISIADNGIGFEQEYAEKVFQIFQRLHGKAEYPGSGIGLSICKKIVDKHNGIIFAQSELNKGTTFFIILPEKQ